MPKLSPEFREAVIVFLILVAFVVVLLLLAAHSGGPAPVDPCDITSRTGC